MAFNQNLEADRIDGFNLISAFVRVPLLVLNGILGNDDASKHNDFDSVIAHADRIDEDAGEDICDESCLDSRDRVGDTSCTNRLTQRRQPLNTGTVARSSPIGMKRTKKMSWSDESGLPLVYENDENSCSPCSSVTTNSQRPMKSSMRKPRAIRNESHKVFNQDRNAADGTSRYIPNMNPRTTGNGLIMPTRPFGRQISMDKKILGSNGSEMSPQWGWYINTTPPTPEMYHSRSSPNILPPSVAPAKHQLVRTAPSRPNEVFQNLQNSTKSNRGMGGWTSIPI